MNNKGFSLLEITIVLLILGLITAGLLGPMSTRIEQKERQETQAQLEEIREALLGYVVLNGVFPCPSTEVDPANPAYGVPDVSCSSSPTIEGYLPWKVLGVTETDAWGNSRSDSTDPANGLWFYRVDRNYTSSSITPITLSSGFSDNLNIVDAAGNSLISTSQHPVAIVFSAGKDLIPNGQNASFDTTYQSNSYVSDTANRFDDMMIWLTRPVFFYRMVQAGRLP